jgi:hemerythrin
MELIPLEETMALRWSKSLSINEQKRDATHRLVIDAASQLIDNIIKGEDSMVNNVSTQLKSYLGICIAHIILFLYN